MLLGAVIARLHRLTHAAPGSTVEPRAASALGEGPRTPRPVKVFLAGDVMTGRGIDQILPNPVDSKLHEPYVEDANVYVELARRRHGPFPVPVAYDYIWGDALDEFKRAAPDLRIVNLETAVTTHDDYWKGKSVHYRMHPRNVLCLTAAGIDCCALANNHVLDWGYAGLEETLRSLHSAGIKTAGAGRNLEEAQRPAIFELSGGPRVLVFAAGSRSSGIPSRWAADSDRPGVHLIDEASPGAASQMRPLIAQYAHPGDLVVVSIHWGPNWGYDIPRDQRQFAHALIDEADVDIVHGHSSHHVKGIEVYREKPILYGCGDFLNDYEGIEGYESYRGDLGLMYFVSMERVNGNLVGLEMRPTQMKRMRVTRASRDDAAWLAEVLDRECRQFGTRVELAESGALILRYDREAHALGRSRTR